MKIILTSDIHGNKEALKQILLRHKDADLYLDAGDSQLSPRELSPFISVKGNCDYDIDLLHSFTLSTPIGKLYIQHLPTIPYSVLYNEEIKIIINGHTHIPSYKKIENTYFLNPGSLTYPRSKDVGTYMIIEIKDKIDIKILEL